MFQLRTEDRLRSWREFRSNLDSITLDNALPKIAEFWARAPFVPYNLDINNPDSWPSPWELINENIYCDLAKCLGIIYTIHLTDHGKNLGIELRVYVDPKTRYEYNLAFIDQGKYILNMIDGEVLNIDKFDKILKLKNCYTAVDLHLENYI